MRGEGFVEFDYVHLVERQARFFEGFATRPDRPDAHDARLHTHNRRTDDASERLQVVVFQAIFRSDEQSRRAVVQAERESRDQFLAASIVMAIYRRPCRPTPPSGVGQRGNDDHSWEE